MSRSKAPPPLPDAMLWEQATKDVKPLRKRRPKAVSPPAAPAPEPLPGKPKRPAANAKPPPRPLAPPPAPPPRPLAAGESAGLDRRSAERLRKGQVPIEEVLDLHGMTQERAHRALERFLGGAAAAGTRCVLVVTGKGRSKEEGGVLKREVPRWLNEPDLRGLVLAIATARPNHGGEGALYLLLKRRREERG
jgi:DNA-nicking Smr family endonuclease